MCQKVDESFGPLKNGEFWSLCVCAWFHYLRSFFSLTSIFFHFLCSGIKLMECNLDKKVSIDNFIESNYIILTCR